MVIDRSHLCLQTTFLRLYSLLFADYRRNLEDRERGVIGIAEPAFHGCTGYRLQATGLVAYDEYPMVTVTAERATSKLRNPIDGSVIVIEFRPERP